MSAKAIEILVVTESSDPGAIVKTLAYHFAEARIHTVATSAELSPLLNDASPALVVCDWSMRTMEPAGICAQLRGDRQFKKVFIVALTYSRQDYINAVAADADQVIEISDPSRLETLVSFPLSLTKRLIELQLESGRLESRIRNMEAHEQQIVSAMQRTIHVRFPDAVDRAPFIEAAVDWIIDQFRNEEESELEKTQIHYAAQLACLGKIHLPDSERNTRITIDGTPTNNYTAFVPLQADAILEGVDALEGARTILKNVYENYDGTGFPDRKQHWQIPLGSRILRAVCDLDELVRTTKCSGSEALEQIKKFNRHVYDHRVVALLEEFILNVSRRATGESETKAVQLFDLHEGMTLASDIVTNSGLKLMNAGTILREQLITRIQSHNVMDPILGNIYVNDD